MRELSLHLLDLIENSLAAGARRVAVTVRESRAANELALVVEDDGRGFGGAAERAVDPFFSTKPGKRTGLGLSLFAGAAAQAGGGLRVADTGRGARIEARLELDHADRVPLGDLAATLSTIACTHPDVQLTCTLVGERGERHVASEAVKMPGDAITSAERLAARVWQAQREAGVYG